MNFQVHFPTPVNTIRITGDEEYIFSIWFIDKEPVEVDNPNTVLLKAKLQLEEYFDGKRQAFDLPLKMNGTGFQNQVWRELQNISFGETASYLQMAERLGDVKNIRAAASANGKNPFAIVVPCHRVIGSDGSLTGYAGGLWRKQWLLDHEQKVLGKYNKLF